MDPAKERALAEMVVEEAKRRHHEGSLELVSKEVSWRNQIGLLDISEGGLAANVKSWLSSEVGEVPGSVVPEASDVDKPGGFWFAVNAELVVYGATEPGAKVLVGNRPLRLRPDGTFSCRFALPDGEYQLEFSAVNAAGSEARAVELRLSRTTRASGGVGNAPQDSGLKVPGPDSAA